MSSGIDHAAAITCVNSEWRSGYYSPWRGSPSAVSVTVYTTLNACGYTCATAQPAR